MSLVEENSVDDSFDRFIKRSVFKDDICSFTAKFKRCRNPKFCGALRNKFSNFGRAGECNLVDIFMRHKCCACGTVPCNDVDNASRKFCLTTDIGKEKCSQRCGLRRLENNSISSRQRWCDFPCQHQQRKIPWNYLCDDAMRLGISAKTCVLQFIGPTSVVEEMCGG